MLQKVELGETTGLEVIGYDEATQSLKSRYFDSTGLYLDYRYALAGDQLSVSIDYDERKGEFRATFAADGGSYTGSWNWTEHGEKKGYSVTMTRIFLVRPPVAEASAASLDNAAQEPGPRTLRSTGISQSPEATMTVTREDAESFFGDYGRALSARDAKAVACHWGTPGLVLSDDGEIPVTNAAQIERFFASAMGPVRRCCRSPCGDQASEPPF